MVKVNSWQILMKKTVPQKSVNFNCRNDDKRKSFVNYDERKSFVKNRFLILFPSSLLISLMRHYLRHFYHSPVHNCMSESNNSRGGLVKFD